MAAQAASTTGSAMKRTMFCLTLAATAFWLMLGTATLTAIAQSSFQMSRLSTLCTAWL
jgi:hypothetical protein